MDAKILWDDKHKANLTDGLMKLILILTLTFGF